MTNTDQNENDNLSRYFSFFCGCVVTVILGVGLLIYFFIIDKNETPSADGDNSQTSCSPINLGLYLGSCNISTDCIDNPINRLLVYCNMYIKGQAYEIIKSTEVSWSDFLFTVTNINNIFRCGSCVLSQDMQGNLTCDDPYHCVNESLNVTLCLPSSHNILVNTVTRCSNNVLSNDINLNQNRKICVYSTENITKCCGNVSDINIGLVGSNEISLCENECLQVNTTSIDILC